MIPTSTTVRHNWKLPSMTVLNRLMPSLQFASQPLVYCLNRMNFRDVPNLLKFEQHARGHSDNEIVMDCYKRIREVIAPVPNPPGALDSRGAPIADLRASCEAVEKSTRLLWACAAATDQIIPRLWDYLPDYKSSVDYFLGLNDLELMAVTKQHRIGWEETATV